MEKLEMDGQ